MTKEPGGLPARRSGAARFPLVDGLRATAALSLFVYHLNLVQPFDGDAARLAGRGNTGVVLFYLISGFLLWRPFALSLLSGAPIPDVRTYAWRRFLRIVPAYWFALTMLALLTSSSNAMPGGPFPYYFFLQSYDAAWKNHGIGQAWTL